MQSAEYLDSDDEVLTFRTPRWTRIWSIAYSCAVGGFCFPTSFYFALMIYIFADFEGAPLIASVGLALLFLAFATRLTWKLCLAPLRFSLTIGKNVVEAGRGWLRCVFACDEVEMISMPDKRKVHGIALEGGGRGAFVYLSPTAELICAALLRHRCPNAVFVDRWGNEHLPICANQPLLTLTALYKNSRSLALGSLATFLVTAAISVVMTVSIVILVFVNRPITITFDLLKGLLLYSCVTSAAVFSARYAIAKWRQAQAVKMKISELRLKNSDGDAR